MERIESVARRVILRAFRAGVDDDRAQSRTVRIATARLADPNLKEAERERLRRRVIRAG